jgi:ubiquinone/menaquinone biosynthesis C-methylase UbiE
VATGEPFKDHFSLHAAEYAAHRPTYPGELIDLLAGVVPRHELALDCACGTGQLSVPLAARFDRVVATDASAGQIAHAEPHPRVEYRVAPADGSGLPDASADIITVAQAAHWLDLDRFYAEVRRVARPGAAVALITYDVPRVDAAVDAVVQRFYHDVVGRYWTPERRHVEDGYRSLPFPFAEIPARAPAMECVRSRDAFAAYVDTWSAVRQAEKAEGRAPFVAFAHELAHAWGPADVPRVVRWRLSIRLGGI